MGTDTELWPLSTLRSARQSSSGQYEVDPNNPIVFTVPAFQRSLVWPEQKQRDLVSSILKGHPFGALLLVEKPEKREVISRDGSKVAARDFGIIDGLQRTNAIVEHLRNSLAFATSDAVRGPAFDAFESAVSSFEHSAVPSTDELIDAVVGWMHSVRTPDITEGFDFDTMLEAVGDQIDLDLTSQEARARLKNPSNLLLQHISKRVDISNLKIPVLIYNGPSEHLPEIFEKINTAGTILSKYEIYAASWVTTRVVVERSEIRSAIARRYKRLADEGFELDRQASGREASLFDYLHGLSQFLGEEFPRLFSSSAAKKNQLSAAFPLATLLLGQSLDKMDRLDQLFPEVGGLLKVDAFERALLEAARLVNDTLAPFLAFRFKSDRESLAHGELQIVSMIAAAAAHLFKHQDDFAPRGSAKSRKSAKKALKAAIPQHYIYDIIRQQWRGSLYTYAADRVWENGSPSKTYTLPVEASAFDSALATAFSDQIADVTRKRRNVTAADRALLRFLYSPIVSVQDQNANQFDVEHWIPVKRIQAMTEDGEPWAIGAVGNLGVLPMGANRIKRDETVKEYLTRTRAQPSAPVADLVEKMVLVPIEYVDIPKHDGKDAMTKQAFDNFIKSNWSEMTAQLKRNVGL